MRRVQHATKPAQLIEIPTEDTLALVGMHRAARTNRSHSAPRHAHDQRRVFRSFRSCQHQRGRAFVCARSITFRDGPVN
jgi:hypothetical protein